MPAYKLQTIYTTISEECSDNLQYLSVEGGLSTPTWTALNTSKLPLSTDHYIKDIGMLNTYTKGTLFYIVCMDHIHLEDQSLVGIVVGYTNIRLHQHHQNSCHIRIKQVWQQKWQ